MDKVPIYPHTGAYAKKHGELDAYRASHQEDMACKKMIEDVIRSNFDGIHLNKSAAKLVLDEFGTERTIRVLANTVQQKNWDGRFSSENKAWAKAQDILGCGGDPIMCSRFAVNSHPAVLDGFISQTRRMIEERASVKDKLNRSSSPIKPSVQRKEPER